MSNSTTSMSLDSEDFDIYYFAFSLVSKINNSYQTSNAHYKKMIHTFSFASVFVCDDATNR